MDDRTRPPKPENWPLQDAKNRFSEVVRRARSEGPQTVTVHGRRAAVVLSAEDYDALAAPKPKRTLVDHLLAAPFDPEFAELIDDRSSYAPEREIEF
ncbi:type II toxin-antitoxin system Phd/YefM family antitoxin [Phreatobacter sp.]|uniref:type II toxin-antitoxin system Phd/YefM family antitoxin n=1 Tax=Phreatobacter sp. TaxID=1966341 RepID=UPI003F6FC846